VATADNTSRDEKVVAERTTTQKAVGAHRPAEAKTAEATPAWRTSFLGADDSREAGRNISWGSIFAGIMTFLAVLFTLGLIATAMGFGLTDFTSSNPFEGVGVGFWLTAVIALILAFLAGGFVSGVFSIRAGFLHGLMTWAGSVLASVILLGMLASSVLGLAGNVLGAAGNAAGSAASAAASAAGNAVSGLGESLSEAVGDVNTDELQANMRKALRDTEVPELQPDYINNQLQGARQDAMNAGRALLVNPNDYQAILDDLGKKLQARIDTIANAADRDAIANAVAKNTDLTPEEASQATNNIYWGLKNASAEAQRQLENAQQYAQEAAETVQEAVDTAREAATDATNAAAKAAGWGSFGLLLGAAISAFGGLWGARTIQGRREDGELRREAVTTK